MNVFEVAAIALSALVLLAVLKKVSPEQGVLLSIGAVLLVLLLMLEGAVPLINQLQIMMETELFNHEYIQILVKAIGITIVGQVTEGICKDCGESGLAYGVSIAARTAVLLLSMPLLGELFRNLSEVLGG